MINLGEGVRMKQVLIVDDEVSLLKSIEVGLKNYQDQFSVLTAHNGKEAVDVLRSNKIDLVISDLRMPEMDGFELLAVISAAYPFLPAIVMTAFATPEIEDRLNFTGSYRLLEKPLDFEKLAEAITDGLEQESKDGSVAGFSLENFLQLLAMEKKTSLLYVKAEKRDGYIFLDRGEVRAAISGELKGEEAFFALLGCGSVQLTFKKLPKKRVVQMINKPLMTLLVEGMQRIDEYREEDAQGSAADEEAAGDELPAALSDAACNTDGQEEGVEPAEGENPDVSDNPITIGDNTMGKLEDTLNKMVDVDGFLAVGIFSPNGELVAQVNKSDMKLAEIGSIANDVLLKAQKATEVMAVGLGNVVHVQAPKAHVIARCLNENTDFTHTEAGKAHIHMVLLLEQDGNLAMGKMKLESVIGEVAGSFR